MKFRLAGTVNLPEATLLNKMWDRLTAMIAEDRLFILRVAAGSRSHDDLNITRTNKRRLRQIWVFVRLSIRAGKI